MSRCLPSDGAEPGRGYVGVVAVPVGQVPPSAVRIGSPPACSACYLDLDVWSSTAKRSTVFGSSARCLRYASRPTKSAVLTLAAVRPRRSCVRSRVRSRRRGSPSRSDRWCRRRRYRPGPRRATPGFVQHRPQPATLLNGGVQLPAELRRRRRCATPAPTSSRPRCRGTRQGEAVGTDVVAGQLGEDASRARGPQRPIVVYAEGGRRPKPSRPLASGPRTTCGPPSAVRATGDDAEPVVGEPHHGQVERNRRDRRGRRCR